MFCYPATLEKDPETGAVLVGFADIPFCKTLGDRPRFSSQPPKPPVHRG